MRGWLTGVAVVLLVAFVLHQWQPPARAPGPLPTPRPNDALLATPVVDRLAAEDPSPPPPVPETPAPPPPKLAPGQPVTITLTEPAALRYLDPPSDDNDAFYARIVDEESHGRAVFDPALGHAAREFVYQFENLGQDPPSDVRTFLITAAGALAGDTVFQHARSSSDAESTLRQAVRAVLTSPPSGTGRLHVGVGEVYQPGARMSRHVGVVATPLWIDVAPMARAAALGTTWTVRGTLRAPWQHLEAILLRPDGTLTTMPVDMEGLNLRVAVPVGTTRGTLEMQVVGEGPDGPGKVVQAAVEVDQPPPTTYQTVLAPDEATLKSADAAAAYAFALLNADRHRHGVPLLQWDPALADVARDHSADMRDHGFFGHVSPTTGLHMQRLDAAGYLAMSSAENVAHNPSVYEAELGLMHSLGHRRNILNPAMTHGGIGVAGAEDENGRRRWWVTQLFARPVVRVPAATMVARVAATVAQKRAEAGLGALVADAELDAVAAESLDVALRGDMHEASGAALRRVQAARSVHGRVRVWAALAAELEALTWPDAVLAKSAVRLGIGAKQGEDGRWAVVLLVADDAGAGP